MPLHVGHPNMIPFTLLRPPGYLNHQTQGLLTFGQLIRQVYLNPGTTTYNSLPARIPFSLRRMEVYLNQVP